MLICTLEQNVSGGMDGCMYVNMYIYIWWYGRLYVLIYTLVSGDMDGCMYHMYICIWWYGRLYIG